MLHMRMHSQICVQVVQEDTPQLRLGELMLNANDLKPVIAISRFPASQFSPTQSTAPLYSLPLRKVRKEGEQTQFN